jgi:hypothetical protein
VIVVISGPDIVEFTPLLAGAGDPAGVPNDAPPAPTVIVYEVELTGKEVPSTKPPAPAPPLPPCPELLLSPPPPPPAMIRYSTSPGSVTSKVPNEVKMCAL